MAFRKRNTPLGRPQQPTSTLLPNDTLPAPQPSIRPSPLTSHPVTSTGTASLDGLLGGHTGLILGSSLLVEEHGTTDYAGALVRFFAAEGILQGHFVHVVGVREEWVRDLPGAVDENVPRAETNAAAAANEADRMKIAWRYEKLGQAGERVLPNRSGPQSATATATREAPFCHQFDLTKRLIVPPDAKINYIAIAQSSPKFGDAILKSLSTTLQSTPPNTIHRLIIPSILSPALYPPSASLPENLMSFFHSLRGLLRRYSSRLVAIISLPLDLYPRNTPLIRWAEILSDGVLELTPFPHRMDAPSASEPGDATTADEARRPPQGMLRVHKLPLNTARGEGGAGVGNESVGADLAFTLGRKSLVVKPYSLPPVEGDQEAQAAAAAAIAEPAKDGKGSESSSSATGVIRAKDVEF